MQTINKYSIGRQKKGKAQGYELKNDAKYRSKSNSVVWVQSEALQCGLNTLYSAKELQEAINFYFYTITPSSTSPVNPTPTFQPRSQCFPKLAASFAIEKLWSGCVSFPNNLTWSAYLPPHHHQNPLRPPYHPKSAASPLTPSQVHN